MSLGLSNRVKISHIYLLGVIVGEILTVLLVLNAYQERHQTLLRVLLYGLFQSASSQAEMLVAGQKPDLDQRDQTCFFK